MYQKVKCDVPLQRTSRINDQNMGFERTLIIVDEGAHYVEGCGQRHSLFKQLHAAIVEIFVEEGGYCRYTTIQNWSTTCIT